jgi:hypothetical protein
MEVLATVFHREMVGVDEVAAEHGYHATYFRQMVERHGGVEAARRLLADSNIQSGLLKLWELGLLGHSMEAIVVQVRYQPLFSSDEIAEARRRLEELGYRDVG